MAAQLPTVYFVQHSAGDAVSVPSVVFTDRAGPSTSEVGARLRVLVVDDHAPAAQSLAMLLNLWGFDVCVCRNGVEALAAALPFRPDAVLLDIMLPGMDGYELARRLREHDELQPLTLIAVTGLGDNAHVRRAHEAGFVRHLLKPLIHDELQEILDALGQRKQGMNVSE